MIKEQTAATVTAISDLMHALRYATTEDKAEICAGLKAGTRHSISASLSMESPEFTSPCRPSRRRPGCQARA
jgi:hypothetical protein